MAVSLKPVQTVRKHLRDGGYAHAVERSYAGTEFRRMQRQLQISRVFPCYTNSPPKTNYCPSRRHGPRSAVTQVSVYSVIGLGELGHLNNVIGMLVDRLVENSHPSGNEPETAQNRVNARTQNCS